MKSLILISLLYLLTGCLTVRDSEKPQDEVIRQPGAEVVNTDASQKRSIEKIEVKPMPFPNKYQVRLPLPEESEVIHRYEESNPHHRTLLSLDQDGGALIDNDAGAGLKYNYEYSKADGGTLKITRVLAAFVPRDRVFNHGHELTGNEIVRDFNRVYILGTVYLKEFSLDIQSDQIVSTDGRIETFPKGTKVTSRINGRNGGRVKIQVRTGDGSLGFNFRGEHGLDGESCTLALTEAGYPSCSDNGMPATNGGATGSGEISISQFHSLKIHASFEPGLGGARGGNYPAGSNGSKGTFCVTLGSSSPNCSF